MKAYEFIFESTQTTLGGFKVTPLHIEDQEVSEGSRYTGDGIHPKLVQVLTQRGYKGPYQLGKLKKWFAHLSTDVGAEPTDEIMVTGNDVDYDEWVLKQQYGDYAFGSEGGYTTGNANKVISNTVPMSEAIGLNAPHRRMSRDELQGYADRIKTGTKTKKDKFSPIIHGSNIKAITKDDNGTEWDLDDLSRQITTRPKSLLGTNAKMSKSATEGEIVYDLTLPALSGVVVDEGNGDFVEITTCPGAGACQLFCYARKGGYVMFPASSMSAAQALNFLINDPPGYTAMVNREIQGLKGKADKHGIRLVVRWHDAGDFFSKEYLDLAFGVARQNPDVQFYAYTKIADVATANKPANFIINFSSGSKRGEEKKIEFHKSAGNVVKQGVTVPKELFAASKQDVASGRLPPVVALDAKGKPVKDVKGRTQFIDQAALDEFKRRLAAKYHVDAKDIITYDQMLATPVGTEPKWHVIVQPGAGDRAANRKDVIDSYLLFH